MYYVTMTDKFFSNMGRTTAKLVFECTDYEQACIVEENASRRSEMIRINICSNFPRYPRSYRVDVKTIKDYPNFYKPGYVFAGGK